MNHTAWKENETVCAQYAQALRAIREQVGENPTRNLERTGRIDIRLLGTLVDVVTRHHETLLKLEDPTFFDRVRNGTGTAHRYMAKTPVGTFLFDVDLAQLRYATPSLVY